MNKHNIDNQAVTYHFNFTFNRNEYIDVIKKLAKVLKTTSSFLLGDTNELDIFKDPTMLKRLDKITSFAEEDRKYIFYTLDALIKNVKLKSL